MVARVMIQLLMFAGLVLSGLSFVALDRGWWSSEPWWIVHSPVAAGVGATGLMLFGMGMVLWRRGRWGLKKDRAP